MGTSHIQVEPQPIPKKLGLWRWLTRWLPGHCKYCGKPYVPVYKMPAPFVPLGTSGAGCPLGHVGYVKGFNIGYGLFRDEFDYVKYPPREEELKDG